MSRYDILFGEIYPSEMPAPMQTPEQPLSEATFFILLSLAPEPKHGYAIMKAAQELSEGRVTLSTGTLYGALKRLLEGGWIARFENAEEAGENGRERKFYRLTQQGRRILAVEVARLKSLVSAAEMNTAEGEA